MHLLPSRWRRGPTRSDVMQLQPNEFEQDTPPDTPESLPPAVIRGQEARRGEESRRAVIVEPRFPLRAEREAAAATVGVDEGTYNLLMDMQHREITPDDYEMLRSLDTSVKPKTLSPRTLEICAPCWEIPETCVPGTVTKTGAATQLFAAEQRCSICMESLVAGERVRRLPCTPARSKWAGSQQPTRPPTAPEARPLAQGHPLRPTGAPSPLGCQWGAAAALCCYSAATLLPAHSRDFDAV
jgi:hypothetical protein